MGSTPRISTLSLQSPTIITTTLSFLSLALKFTSCCKVPSRQSFVWEKSPVRISLLVPSTSAFSSTNALLQSTRHTKKCFAVLKQLKLHMPTTSRNLIGLLAFVGHWSCLHMQIQNNSNVIATYCNILQLSVAYGSLVSRPCWIAVLLDGSKVQPKRTEVTKVTRKAIQWFNDSCDVSWYFELFCIILIYFVCEHMCCTTPPGDWSLAVDVASATWPLCQ